MKKAVIFGVILGIAFGVWITNEALFSEDKIPALCAIFVTAVIGGWFARVAYGITHEDTSKNQKKD
ncbi:MAG: hypothetical protein AAB345_00980 [Patescibacteria group bacterium]